MTDKPWSYAKTSERKYSNYSTFFGAMKTIFFVQINIKLSLKVNTADLGTGNSLGQY